jgi:hypothetical protein
LGALVAGAGAGAYPERQALRRPVRTGTQSALTGM